MHMERHQQIPSAAAPRTPSDFSNYQSGHGRELENSETCQILISDAYTNSCMSQRKSNKRKIEIRKKKTPTPPPEAANAT